MLLRRLFSCRRLTPAIALAVALLSLATASAAQPSLQVEAVQIGWEGKYKAGHWTRLKLTLSSNEKVRGSLRLIVPDGDGVPVAFGDEEAPLEFQLGESQTTERYVQAGSIRSTITAEFLAETGGTWRQTLAVPAPLSATQSIVLTLGPEIGVKRAVQNLRRRKEESVVDVTVASAADLPDDWFAYHAVEAVYLPTSAHSLEPHIAQEQRSALQQWVALGGRLILSVGSRAEELTGPEGTLRELAPGEFEKATPLTRTVGLESLTGSPLGLRETFGRAGLPVVQWKEFSGAIELREGAGEPPNRPLVIRAPYRFGQVVTVGFDIDDPGLVDWAGQPAFLASLMTAGKREEGDVSEESRGQVTELGYTDLAGQLRVALEQFPSVTFVDFTSIALLIFAYLAIIGPGDYFFLERLGLPKHLTWVTFPLVTLLFAGLGVYLARRAHGESVRVTQAEVVDLDLASGQMRGAHWTHLYSPETQRFDLNVQSPSALDKDITRRGGWLGWQGLPGKGVGGLGATQTAPVRVSPYAEPAPNPEPALVGLPLQTASSKALTGRWWGAFAGRSQSTLELDAFGTLRGELTNPLPVDLIEPRLLYAGWMYFLSDPLAAGETVDLRRLRYFSLEARLTQRKSKGDKDVSTPWDPQLSEVGQIMPMMLFHGAARGQAYTGLSHRYQSYVDLSEHLTTGRAILMGRSRERLVEITSADGALTDDQYDQSWTWWRVVLPVQGAARQ